MLRAVSILLLLAATAAAEPFTAADMMKLERLSDPSLSRDGKWVAWSSTRVSMPAGTRNTDVWLALVAGGEPRQLTFDPASDSGARFSPDGKRVAFISSRGGSSQAWVIDMAGGEARRLTSLATEVDALEWAGNDMLVVASSVFPDCLYEPCQKTKLEEAAATRSTARVYDDLLFRHWDAWEDQRRTHLLAVPLDGNPWRDLTPGERDAPPFSVSGPVDFAVSPDGSEVCFARNDDTVLATSTNADLFVVPTAGGEAKKIADTAGYDAAPRYSPDGTRIAYRAQARAGFEADRWVLKVYDRKTGETRGLTEKWDRQVEDVAWSRDGLSLYLTAEDEGHVSLFTVPARGGPVRRVAKGGSFTSPSATDAGTLVATMSSLTHPNTLVRVSVALGTVTPITRFNETVLAPFKLKPGESVTYEGADKKRIQAWITKPSDFDAAKKYPLLVLIHGGPQGAWNDGWTFRWNAQVFANAGYVVLQPNVHGSIGWGQEFTDAVSGDWGGRAYEDVMKGTDFAEALPYVEAGRTVAAGASYGGYMVNWIAGHTNRYRALVSHDGTFDLEAMAGATEEQWFTDWEFKGLYWEKPEQYEKWSPNRFVQNFKTPTLVVHGERDYRVPVEQGLAMYTALQRMGVPSRLVVFPDENHWVLKPNNSIRWYQEVIRWLDQWSRK